MILWSLSHRQRPGAFAVYLEPWHPDIFDFLDLKKNHGAEEKVKQTLTYPEGEGRAGSISDTVYLLSLSVQRARDLFFALWIPDLFMKRVEKDADWSLFCPNEAPGLADCWGDKFEELYEKYEKEGRAKKTVKAQKIWFAILESQTETGVPYMMYKDACNHKSNQQVRLRPPLPLHSPLSHVSSPYPVESGDDQM